MRFVKFAAVAVAMTMPGAVNAQSAPAGPAPVPTTIAPPPEMRGPDDRMTDFNRMRDDVAGRKAGPTRSKDPIPVVAEDVTVGSEVRDSKGVVIGSITSVAMGFAVVTSPAGKIEVEFASIAKNNKGLLINMPKAKFDAIVAGSGKPAH